MVTSAASSHQEVRSRESERHGEIEPGRRHADCQGNQCHHSGQALGELGDGPFNEDGATISEEQRPKRCGDPARPYLPTQSVIAEPMLDHWRPYKCRDRQQQRPPKPPAKHFGRVTGVLAVAGVHLAVHVLATRGMISGRVTGMHWASRLAQFTSGSFAVKIVVGM